MSNDLEEQKAVANLEAAVVETLASTSTRSSSTRSDGTDDQALASATGDEDNEYKDGDLPDFSDPEDQAEPKPVLASSLNLKGAKAVRGPAGRKKIPLAALKQRLAPSQKSTKPQETPPPRPPPPSAQKGKGKASFKMTDAQIDLVIDKYMASSSDSNGPARPRITRDEMVHMIELLQIDQDVVAGRKGLMGKGAKDIALPDQSSSSPETAKGHKFWKTQPVAQDNDSIEQLREGPIEPDKKPHEISREAVPLHKDFKWVTIDLNDPNELKEVYELLTHHYVEDADASFRFDYAAEFIEWALKPPGYVPDWHVGIRVSDTNKLVGFISGIPVDLRIRTVIKRCTEINFLVVHKKLRSKRLAPVLIQEVTRRTHLHGTFQAIYTSGTVLPTPFTTCQYYHRNLNPAKLVKLGFSAVPRNSTIARMSTYYRTPSEPSLPGLREIEKKDLKDASRLLRAYLARFDCAPMLSNKEIEHALWSGRGKGDSKNGHRTGQVVWTYVVEDPETRRITDLFSLYSLPSTAVKSQPLQAVNAAYLFYYATDQTPSTRDLGDGSTAHKAINWKDESEEDRKGLKLRLDALIGDALVCSQKLGFDVLNALTLQDNSLFLEDLKFGRGDGFLNFYLYNYHTKPIEGGIDPVAQGSGIGVVML